MRSTYIFGALMGLVLLSLSTTARADVNINVGITPPPLAFHGPPELAVIPGTYVYYLPDVQEDIFFYHGYWYRPFRGRWYRSAGYEGPWVYITTSNVPAPLYRLPPRFRTMEVYRRVPYREFNRNWRAWERDRYWDRVARERHDMRERGVAPRFDERGRRFDDWGRDRHDFDRDRERHDRDREHNRDRERGRDHD
jgi:hypothetical protein